MKVSDCCGAEATGEAEDIGICPDCKEHCGFIEEEDEQERQDKPVPVKKIRTANDGSHIFYCPGCDCLHSFKEPTWAWNKDPFNPTVSPSLLSWEGDLQKRCHLFIVKGQIRYLADCAHKLATQFVEMQDFYQVYGILDDTPRGGCSVSETGVPRECKKDQKGGAG